MYGRQQMGFGPPVTPPIIKQLLIINAAVFVAQVVLRGSTGAMSELELYGAVSPIAFWKHYYIWQPFTYMWLHGGPMHLLFNLFGLWMFGSTMALQWGEQRFLKYYLVCGVGAGLFIASVPWLFYAMGLGTNGLGTITIGASGAVYGVILAYAFTWPDRTIMLMIPPIPIKAIWFIPVMFFLQIAMGGGGISHTGHLGGVLVGWLYLLQEGRTPGAPTWKTIQHKWRRYKLRQQLRAVRQDEWRDRDRFDDDRRFH
ncbi:MAG: rhomboid family intramembrane serine protease [Proteobacteria bacterium]|nr:rhomboid family intramembrane serine protease [Pseudomonadota bacterium]